MHTYTIKKEHAYAGGGYEVLRDDGWSCGSFPRPEDAAAALQRFVQQEVVKHFLPNAFGNMEARGMEAYFTEEVLKPERAGYTDTKN